MDLSSNDQTPKKSVMTEAPLKRTPISTPKNFARFLLLSNNQSFTPSPSLGQRVVRNPFENQLHLHLPVISSPSLFQTLNASSNKQFEWTIEDLALFHPVNIPSPSQYKEDMDPEAQAREEAKAQAAINSFFREHKVGESNNVL
jgi:Protein aurora borealis N-terminus